MNRSSTPTLGLLFVNVSIGGTLTHFAAPPVLMVARLWEWDTAFMLRSFGWRAVLAILAANAVYLLLFRAELVAMASRPAVADVDPPEDEAASPDAPLLPVRWWITLAHMLFMAWTVATSHYPALFVGGFLFFLGFAKATSPYQSRVDLRAPLLVGFFLAGLVIHGGLQGWWIAPLLARLSDTPLFLGAAALTAINDNALITYLATLVPNLSDEPQGGRGSGSRHRRRLDGDRECAEPGWPGPARAVLWWRGRAAQADAGRAGAYGDCGALLQGTLAMRALRVGYERR